MIRDPTQRIHHSDKSKPTFPSLLSLCMKTLEHHKPEIPLYGLPIDLQKRIVNVLCVNDQDLREMEEFNEEISCDAEMEDPDGEDHFDWVDATENRWRQFCKQHNVKEGDLEMARREDERRPYRRLFRMLKERDERKKAIMQKTFMQKKEKDKAASKTVKIMKQPAAHGGRKRVSRARSGPPGTVGFGSSSRSSQPVQSLRMKTVLADAKKGLRRVNPFPNSRVKAHPKPPTRIRRSVPKDKPNSPPKSSRNLSLSQRESQLGKRKMINRDVLRMERQKQASYTPPPVRPVARKRRRINLMDEDRPKSPTGAHTSSTTPATTESLSSMFQRVEGNSKVDRIKKAVKKDMLGKRYDEATKKYLREKKALHSMKIPKKT